MKKTLAVIVLCVCMIGCNNQESNNPLQESDTPLGNDITSIEDVQEEVNKIDQSFRSMIISGGRYVKSVMDEINTPQEKANTDSTVSNDTGKE